MVYTVRLTDDARAEMARLSPNTRRDVNEVLERLRSGADRDLDLHLQDCVAIVIMREYGITSILTADQEFARAGFTPLLRRYLD